MLKIERVQFDNLHRELDAASRGLAGAAIRRALYSGAVLLRDDARKRVPVRLGFLKKAMVARSGVTQGKPRASVGIARVWFAQTLSDNYKLKWRTWKGKQGDAKWRGVQETLQWVRPSRYAHLLEFGAKHMRAQPYMGPALAATRVRMVEQVAQAMREETKKMASKRRWKAIRSGIRQLTK
jgi:HK97 gp10 family phage protein